MEANANLRWDVSLSIEERKVEILRSLGGILRERHVSALTMQDIADRLGMTKGNLYHYFRNKQEILFQCHMKSTEDSLRLLDEVERMNGPPSERLQALIVGLVVSVIEDPYGAIVTTDLESLEKPQRRRYVALRDRFELGLRQIIADGVAAGEFRSGDVKLSGLAILGAINSIARWYDPKGPQLAGEIAEHFADLFLHGLKD